MLVENNTANLSGQAQPSTELDISSEARQWKIVPDASIMAPPSPDMTPDSTHDERELVRSRSKAAPSVSVPATAEDAPPVLDLSASTEKELVEAVRAACMKWGFFQIVGHGVNPELRERFEKAMRDFFALPMDVKLKSERSATNARGFVKAEYTKQKLDNKQCFDVGNEVNWDVADDDEVNQGLNGVNRFPSEADLPGFRSTVREYYHEMERLSEFVGSLMALGMGTHRDYFSERMGNRAAHTSHLRLNYYPELENPGSALGVGPHTDAGFLTLLAQDQRVQTLQVKQRGTEDWVPVLPVEGAFTINTGDLCVIFSNGLYHAPEHRVLSSTMERYSAPYFYNPSYNTEIEPVPELLSHESPSKFHPMQWGYFRAMRVMGNFGDYGEYVKAEMWRCNENGSLPPQVERQERFVKHANYRVPFDINQYAAQMKA